jgi:hypothetical protein
VFVAGEIETGQLGQGVARSAVPHQRHPTLGAVDRPPDITTAVDVVLDDTVTTPNSRDNR